MIKNKGAEEKIEKAVKLFICAHKTACEESIAPRILWLKTWAINQASCMV
jgi:hypothetical protein